MRDLLKNYSWLSLLAALSLALGVTLIAGCSSDEGEETSPTPTVETPTPEASPTAVPATPTPEPPPPTPTPEPVMVNVTFTVDLNIDADNNPDTNLNEVKEGEQVFIVGDMNGWDPNDPAMAMTDNGDGTYSITLELPAGAGIIFKFAKTTSNPDDAWAEGEKDYMNDQDPDWNGCTNFEDDTEGLFEVSNREYTVPESDADAGTFPIDAWRDTAEAYGLHSCN